MIKRKYSDIICIFEITIIANFRYLFLGVIGLNVHATFL